MEITAMMRFLLSLPPFLSFNPRPPPPLLAPLLILLLLPPLLLLSPNPNLLGCSSLLSSSLLVLTLTLIFLQIQSPLLKRARSHLSSITTIPDPNSHPDLNLDPSPALPIPPPSIPSSPSTSTNLKGLLYKFDSNGNGKVSSSDLAAIFSSLDHTLSTSKLFCVMAETDCNSDLFMDHDDCSQFV